MEYIGRISRTLSSAIHSLHASMSCCCCGATLMEKSGMPLRGCPVSQIHNFYCKMKSWDSVQLLHCSEYPIVTPNESNLCLQKLHSPRYIGVEVQTNRTWLLKDEVVHNLCKSKVSNYERWQYQSVLSCCFEASEIRINEVASGYRRHELMTRENGRISKGGI